MIIVIIIIIELSLRTISYELNPKTFEKLTKLAVVKMGLLLEPVADRVDGVTSAVIIFAQSIAGYLLGGSIQCRNISENLHSQRQWVRLSSEPPTEPFYSHWLIAFRTDLVHANRLFFFFAFPGNMQLAVQNHSWSSSVFHRIRPNIVTTASDVIHGRFLYIIFTRYLGYWYTLMIALYFQRYSQ